MEEDKILEIKEKFIELYKTNIMFNRRKEKLFDFFFENKITLYMFCKAIHKVYLTEYNVFYENRMVKHCEFDEEHKTFTLYTDMAVSYFYYNNYEENDTIEQKLKHDATMLAWIYSENQFQFIKYDYKQYDFIVDMLKETDIINELCK